MNLDFIAFPLGQLLNFIYNNIAFYNYGLAIIVFTILIKIVLLPLTIKQYKSTARMQELQPQLQEIQKRYKTDKQKLNEEMAKYYKDNNVNPAGGCAPLLVQMPILFALYYVIQQPLKFMVQLGVEPKQLYLSKEVIISINEKIATIFAHITDKNYIIANMPDISIINYFSKFPEKLSEVSGLIAKSDLLNMNFLGLNLGLVPSYHPSVLNPFGVNANPLAGQYLFLLLIPILAAFTTFIQSKMMPKPAATQSGAPDPTASMQSSMMIMMPIMILIFSFTVPAGLGLYWIVGNVIQIFTQLYINKYIMKKKEVAKA